MDKDGHITTKELKSALKKLGQNPPDRDVTKFIQVCDIDKNGTIEFEEFCRYLVRLRREVIAICKQLTSSLVRYASKIFVVGVVYFGTDINTDI